MAATPTGGASRRRSVRRCRARRRCRLTSRSRACRCAPPAARSPTTSRRSSGPSRAPRSSSRWGCPARAPRPRCSSPTCRTSTCGSMPSTRPEAPSMRDVGTLLEALPYIREFHSKTVVIKYGGAAMEDAELCEEFARDVVLLKYVGLNPIVVHGGGPDITRYMERLALPVEFVSGLRVSGEGTVEVAKMVLVGKVNKDIVLRLGRHGQAAVGLSGDDGALFRVVRRPPPGGRDIGFRGRLDRGKPDVIKH